MRVVTEHTASKHVTDFMSRAFSYLKNKANLGTRTSQKVSRMAKQEMMPQKDMLIVVRGQMTSSSSSLAH